MEALFVPTSSQPEHSIILLTRESMDGRTVMAQHVVIKAMWELRSSTGSPCEQLTSGGAIGHLKSLTVSLTTDSRQACTRTSIRHQLQRALNPFQNVLCLHGGCYICPFLFALSFDFCRGGDACSCAGGYSHLLAKLGGTSQSYQQQN